MRVSRSSPVLAVRVGCSTATHAIVPMPTATVKASIAAVRSEPPHRARTITVDAVRRATGAPSASHAVAFGRASDPPVQTRSRSIRAGIASSTTPNASKSQAILCRGSCSMDPEQDRDRHESTHGHAELPWHATGHAAATPATGATKNHALRDILRVIGCVGADLTPGADDVDVPLSRGATVRSSVVNGAVQGLPCVRWSVPVVTSTTIPATVT